MFSYTDSCVTEVSVLAPSREQDVKYRLETESMAWEGIFPQEKPQFGFVWKRPKT